MNKDTMNAKNAGRDTFVTLLENWHPSFFVTAFLFFVYFAIDFFPESHSMLIWIQSKVFFLLPQFWQPVLFLFAVWAFLAKPGARSTILLIAPAMILGGMVIWYMLSTGISPLISVFVAVSYPAIFGVMVLSASVSQSLENNAKLLARIAELEKQLESTSVANATDEPK